MNVVHSRMRNELQNPFAGDTADLHFDTKVKCQTGWASLWVKFPTGWNKTLVKCLFGGGGGRTVFELTGTEDHYLTSNTLLL